MTEQATINTNTEAPSMEEQAAAFAKENPDAAKAVGMEVEEAPSDGRPDHIPEKFWDAEKQEVRVDDLAKSFGELEKRFSSKPKEEAEDTAKAEAPAEIPEADAAAEEAVEQAGLDLNALSEKWGEKGELDAEDYEALEKVGISKADVEVYVKGREAKLSEYTSAVYNAAGGEEAYGEAISWAADNLSEAKVKAFNEAISSTDPARAEIAVRGLIAEYQAAEGSVPKRRVAGENAPSSAVGFSSQAELMEAMRNPEYQSNPAFRERVKARMEATPAGIL